MGSEPKLTARQRAAIAGLSAGLDKQDVAATVGVRPQTISRYMRDPLFVAALREAQGDILGQVTRRMTDGANQALDVLQSVMKDKAMSPSVRVRAALGWLDQAWRARELNDIEERLADLERRVADANGNKATP